MTVDLNFIIGFLFVADTMLVLILIRHRRKWMSDFVKKLYKENTISIEDRDFYIKEYSSLIDGFGVAKAFYLPRFEDVESEPEILIRYQAFRRKSGLALRLSLFGLLIIAGLAAMLDI